MYSTGQTFKLSIVEEILPYIEERLYGERDLRVEFGLDKLRQERATGQDEEGQQRARPRTMTKLDLKEYEKSEAVPLSASQRDALLKLDILTVEPVAGTENAYHLTPGSTIGALEIGDLSVAIRPKLPIARVLYRTPFRRSRSTG